MKHIFAVISPLTFCIANKIIQLDGIHPDDCIFFSLRDYQIPKQYTDIYKNQIKSTYGGGVYEGRYFAGLNVFKTRRNVRRFDSMIEKFLNGDEFYWYTSSCSDDVSNLMVSHPKCVGYYITEDGISSYVDNPQTFVGIKYWIYKLILKPLFPRFYIAKNHFIETDCPKYKHCIATSQSCFPHQQENLRVIGNPFDEVEIGVKPDAILSIDPLFLFIKDINAIEDIYSRLAAFMQSKHYTTIAYKFHPLFNADTNKEIKNAYLGLIHKYFGKDLFEISPEYILEGILKHYKCDFYTSYSATAIYIHDAGAKCYTYIPLLKKYTSFYDNVPFMDIFTEVQDN